MADEYKVEKLNSENYRHWAMRVQGLLEAKNVWEAVDPGYENDLTDPQKIKDHKAKAIFYLIINDEGLDDIIDCPTAREIWETLQQIHTKYDTWHGLLLLKDFVTTEKKSQEKIGEYLTRRNGLYHKVKHAGFTFEEKVQAGFAALGLPSEYEYLVRNLRIDKDDLQMATLKAKLIEEERRIGNSGKHSSDGYDTEDAKAMWSQRSTVRNKNGSRFRSQDKINQDWRRHSHGTGWKGNEDEQLQNADRTKSQKSLRCYSCLEFGHISKNCTYKDDKKNHNTDCNPKTRFVRTDKLALCTKQVVSNVDHENETTKNCESILMAVHTTTMNHSALSVCPSAESRTDEWVLDSGATDHMSSCKRKFVTFIEQNEVVEVAGGGKLVSPGHGDVELTTSKKNGGRTLTLKNVLYVPELNGNLLSVSQIADKGHKVTLRNACAHIQMADGTVIAEGHKEGRLYRFHESNSAGAKVGVGNKDTAALTVISKDVKLWHQRLGHLHVTAVKELLDRTETLLDTDEKKVTENCETCMMGKFKATSFPKKSLTREKQPLKLVHSDFAGPIKPKSKGGCSYFVTFIDDYSRYNEVHMMRQKSEVLEKFKEYKRRVENYHGTKVTTLRSDNGGEYLGNDFKDYLNQNGIERQLTIPGTPQQNGVAERANQTLMDAARCMLIESGMPIEFWGDALATACYIRNRCPTIANDGIPPLELWKEGLLDLSHLRIFGCRAWALNKKRENKLAPKGIPCIFIGYDKYAKAYRLWNPESDRVFISRDVKFEEKVFPMRTMKYETETTPDKHPHSMLEWCGFSVDEVLHSTPDITEDDSVDQNGHQSEPDDDADLNAEEGRNAGNQKTTRSGRRVIPPIWTSDYAMNKVSKCNQVKTHEERKSDPQTPREALKGDDRENWKNSMIEEIENLTQNETWELVPRPKDRKIIRTKWVFKTKYDEDGNIARYRSRVVALGNTQAPGIDFDKTYSPVVQKKSMRILFGIAAEKGWQIHHMDVTAAYLIAELEDDVYMEMPEQFEQLSQEMKKCKYVPSVEELQKGKFVCKLRKSIYGLHQSGRLWNNHLDHFLKSQGLERSCADPCVYYQKGHEMFVAIYVDDILLYGVPDEIERMKKDLKENFETKDLGEVSHVLSVRVKRTDDEIILDQTTYANELLREFNMDKSKGTATPLALGVKYKACEDGDELDEEKSALYRKAIGSLLYMATSTRPDLAFSATYMSQFNQKPSNEHWTGMKHMLRYLKNTSDLSMAFRKTKKPTQVYTDADWGSDPTDRRSFSGYVIILGGAAVSWCSRKQRCVSLSTVEAEFIALNEVVKECTWIRNLLTEIGLREFIENPMTIRIDNQGAIKLAENQFTSDRSKHIDLKVFHIREQIDRGLVTLDYVPTHLNMSDQFTKVLPGTRMREHLTKMGIKDPGRVLK